MMAPSIDKDKTERPKEVQHDESPSGVTDHPFEPKGAWWTLCKHCNLAQSAHADTTVKNPVFHLGTVADDMVEDD